MKIPFSYFLSSGNEKGKDLIQTNDIMSTIE